MPDIQALHDLEAQARASDAAGDHAAAGAAYAQAADGWKQLLNYDEAARDYSDAAKQHDAGSTDALKQGDRDKAASEEHEELAADVNAAICFYRSGLTNFDFGNWKTSAEMFEAAAVKSKSSARLFERAGALATTDAQIDEGIADAYEKASDRDKDQPDLAKSDDENAAYFYRKAAAAYEKAAAEYEGSKLAWTGVKNAAQKAAKAWDKIWDQSSDATAAANAVKDEGEASNADTQSQREAGYESEARAKAKKIAAKAKREANETK